MKLTPRYYQSDAHRAVIDWWKKTTDPCVVEAATGSGKSVIISMIAKTLYDLSGGKRVLCLAPSKELVEQNAEKYLSMGEPCSIYSASISKSLRHQVIFATEGTFKKVAKRLGHEFAGVIIDECHKITPTIKGIIDDMREGNPNLRVCGLSATPYRLGDGFVFAIDVDGNAIPEHQARDPYFKKLVYYIGAQDLIDQGWLTPVRIGEINAGSYDTSGLQIQRNGQFSQKSVDQAFTGWGRKTADIVADVVAQSADRKGVMLFAATVRHAEEIMASLPPLLSRMIGGKHNTRKAEREKLVRDFKAQRYKYLVSVGTMTTGVDFTHVDVIAILRATESVSLLQQIIGRGLRLHDDKADCLLLDYAGNLDKHCPDGDIFRPEIRAAYHGDERPPLECYCPECGGLNVFSARDNDMGAEVSKNGYFVDLDGNPITNDTGIPIPAHFGRRCQQFVFNREAKSHEQCTYQWTGKECPVCEHLNDISARYCKSCKEELINPNEKLIAVHTRLKRNPREPQCDEVLEMNVINSISRSGNPVVRVEFMTPNRMFPVYYSPESKSQWVLDKYLFFLANTANGTQKPRTVRYKKEDDFYQVLGFNQATDDEILQEKLNALPAMASGFRRSKSPR